MKFPTPQQLLTPAVSILPHRPTVMVHKILFTKRSIEIPAEMK